MKQLSQPGAAPSNMSSMRNDRWQRLVMGVAILAIASSGFAQKAKKNDAGDDRAARATRLHDANVYVAADADSQRVSFVAPGHEVVVVERSSPWVKVFANTDVQEDPEDKPEFGDEN